MGKGHQSKISQQYAGIVFIRTIDTTNTKKLKWFRIKYKEWFFIKEFCKIYPAYFEIHTSKHNDALSLDN